MSFQLFSESRGKLSCPLAGGDIVGCLESSLGTGGSVMVHANTRIGMGTHSIVYKCALNLDSIRTQTLDTERLPSCVSLSSDSNSEPEFVIKLFTEKINACSEKLLRDYFVRFAGEKDIDNLEDIYSVEQIISEFGIMSRMAVLHPDLFLKPLGAFILSSSSRSLFVLEYAPFGSLADFASKYPLRITRDFVISTGLDLARILIALEQCSVIHFDIKPHNVFVMRDSSIRLGDFGCAALVKKRVTDQSLGTQEYMPPELLFGSTVDPLKIDVYSAGVLLWSLVSGNIPFAVLKAPVHRLIAIRKGFFVTNLNTWPFISNDTLILPSGDKFHAPKFVALVEAAVSLDFNARPSPTEFLNYFSNAITES